MTVNFWSGSRSRQITKRIVVEARLTLVTPAHFGGGDGDDLKDMPLLVDPLDQKTPLLTGASISGALRSYLREREHGYGQEAGNRSASVRLFGGLKGDPDGLQSPLVVEDALGVNGVAILRDGVKLNPKTRTAENDKLFDIELWQAGTVFQLRFELLIDRFVPLLEPVEDRETILRRALATALTGLTDGSVTLGSRKRRGYGQIQVSSWRVKTYDLTTLEGLFDWIETGGDSLSENVEVDDLLAALDVDSLYKDVRQRFTIKAEFSLDGSLLIRSGTGRDDLGPDIVHLHAVQITGEKGKSEVSVPEPIISGTSLAGALRARASKIACTLAYPWEQKANAFVNGIFGLFGEDISSGQKPGRGKQAAASRLTVKESVIRHAETEWVQNRVSLDRFTGGARDTALFNEQPVYGDEKSRVILDFELHNPQPAEIGLLLLLLKDLWTGDLPLGGESSVGRGRLKGIKADLTWRNGGTRNWTIQMNENILSFAGDDPQALEEYVSELTRQLQEGLP